jgi:hypothetical protein
VTFQDAYDVFARTLKEDKGLYYAYQSSIAMSMYDVIRDCGYMLPNLHEMVNKGAVRFLDMLIEKADDKNAVQT